VNKHATYQQLRGHLAYLKLTAAAEQLPAALEAAEKTKPGYTQFLHDLLDVEVAATRQRRLASRLRLAGFPSTKTLEEFDFTPNHRSIAGSSMSSRRCALSRRRPTFSPSAHPASARQCSRSRSA
jgi:DNA replication protein DnaC